MHLPNNFANLRSISLGFTTQCARRYSNICARGIGPIRCFSDTSTNTVPNGRQRQHVNPLAAHNQLPVILPEGWLWKTYSKKSPFIIDVGCARGNWFRTMAAENADINYLALEIRSPLVEYNLHKIQDAGLSNAHVLKSNANVDLKNLIDEIHKSQGEIKMICFHNPDPWFKKRHSKRAVITPILLEQLAESLPSGCVIFLQSDVEALIDKFNEIFLDNNDFEIAEGYDINTMEENPYPHSLETERAIAVKENGGNLYRIMFFRK